MLKYRHNDLLFEAAFESTGFPMLNDFCRASTSGNLATRLTSRRRRIIDMKIRSIRIDLGKTTFHLVALGDRGKNLLKHNSKRCRLIDSLGVGLSR